MKMDVVFMTGERKTEIRQMEIGDPQPWEVQIEVAACGVCAWDAYLFKGMSLLQPHPFSIGHEAVGKIIKVGSKVKNFAPGDRVFCIEEQPQMQMAQYTNISADHVGLLPGKPENPAEFARLIGEPCVCVVSSMTNSGLRPGDNVVIIGTGYMGLLNVQAFHHACIGKLICFDIDEKKLALAKKYGADECYISGSAEAEKAAKDIIASGGVDMTVECSSTQSGLQLASDLVRNGGTINNFAWHRAQRTIDTSPWHLRGLKILNTGPAIDRHFPDNVVPTSRLLSRGVFNQEELVTHVMDYHDVQKMLTIAESKAEGYIKGVITFK